MIKSATILPSHYLYLNKNDDFHMCLAQLMCRPTRESKMYTDFHKDQIKRGAFVLMDNGAAEGEQPTAEELVPKILDVQPTETILPDTIYDKATTIEKAKHAMKVYREAGITSKLMGVPQGETFQEWTECCQELIEMGVDSIGISKFITPKYIWDFKTQPVDPSIVRHAAASYVRLLNSEIDIHLLGCYYTPAEISRMATSHLNIRSTDSAIGYVYARGQKLLHPDIPRPEGEIDFLQEKHVDPLLVSVNKERWRMYCHGEL